MRGCVARTLLGGVSSLLLAASAGPAWAQAPAAAPAEPGFPAGDPAFATSAEAQSTTTDDAAGDEASGAGAAEIVVTGTRIASGFASPTPVTVLTNERTEALAITNLGESLNQLPAFRPSVGPNTQANVGGYIGARLLDLRGLNPQRTLVLVDGRRFVPSTATGSVDVNLIPSALVERTDIVTGGASAAYGSDAVAGVVNFMLNRRLTGLKVELQGGVSEVGDNASQYVSIAGGTAIGERVHLIFGGEFENNGGLGNCNSRDWCSNVTSILGNPAIGRNGDPASIIVNGARTASLSPQGLINRSLDAAGRQKYPTVTDPTLGLLPGADPLRGLTFNPDGTTRAFQYGRFVGPLFMVGGEGANRNAYIVPFLLQPRVRRYTGYGSVEAELTDTIKATLDLSYGRVEGHVVANVFRDFNGSLMGTIRSGNPFLPASVQAIMDANAIGSFVFGRAGFDIGPAEADSLTQTYRGVAALQGDLGSRWKWDVGYEYGRTDFRQDGYNTINVANIRNATDAVRNAAGQIVCRINAVAVTDPACAPINLFGENRFTAAAKAYVTGNSFQTTNNTQHDIAANISGSLFDLPAGPLSVAAGLEYRRDSIKGDADAVSRANGFFQLNGSAIQSGAINVKEVYGEAELPILKDSAVAYSLGLNGAVRRTDYSTSGAVTTWKIGGVYEPIQAIRLRVTKSRDIRAPNLNELRGPAVKTTIALSDPLRREQGNPTVFTGSNPDLTPEKADSFTAGIVLAPTRGLLGRMRLSVDYYKIKVNNVIGNLGAQSIVNGCAAGNQTLCALVTRGAATVDPATGASLPGIVDVVRDITLNSQRLKTSGFDIEYRYRQRLGTADEISLQLLGNVNLELVTADGVDRAGQTGFRAGTIPGAPDYTIDGLLTWTHSDFSLTGHGRYIPSGIYWVDFRDSTQAGFSPTAANGVNDNQVPARVYFDLAANLKVPAAFGRSMEFFGAVNNLFDRDPPMSPSATGGTNQILFDPIGRSFRAGVRVYFGG